jgi:hypothetical protein
VPADLLIARDRGVGGRQFRFASGRVRGVVSNRRYIAGRGVGQLPKGDAMEIVGVIVASIIIGLLGKSVAESGVLISPRPNGLL